MSDASAFELQLQEWIRGRLDAYRRKRVHIIETRLLRGNDPYSFPAWYNGVLYESVTEATWAMALDIVRHPARYEPYDYGGHKPDFGLFFPLALGQPEQMVALLEVKPFDTSSLVERLHAGWGAAQDRIVKCDWAGPMLIVGTLHRLKSVDRGEKQAGVKLWMPTPVGIFKRNPESAWAHLFAENCTCCRWPFLNFFPDGSIVCWNCRLAQKGSLPADTPQPLEFHQIWKTCFQDILLINNIMDAFGIDEQESKAIYTY